MISEHVNMATTCFRMRITGIDQIPVPNSIQNVLRFFACNSRRFSYSAVPRHLHQRTLHNIMVT